MSAARLILKQPTGWFAAGHEVALALEMLSDGAFKLYLHLCLQANRHTGRGVLNVTEWAHVLRKDVESIDADLSELQRSGVCERRGDQVEICDRFWPYQKQTGVTASDPEAEFVRQVRAAFLQPACVRSAFTAADEKLTLDLCRRGVGVEEIRRAIWLGCARKYITMLNGQTRVPITSLAYFVALIEEVTQPQIPASYWHHVRRKMEEMEKRWVQAANSTPAANDAAQAAPPEML